MDIGHVLQVQRSESRTIHIVVLEARECLEGVTELYVREKFITASLKNIGSAFAREGAEVPIKFRTDGRSHFFEIWRALYFPNSMHYFIIS